MSVSNRPPDVNMAPAAAGRDIQEEQVLQAVVLADSGQDYELPISETVPKVLVQRLLVLGICKR